MVARGLVKPEYIYNPFQLCRRLVRLTQRPTFDQLTFPWGVPIYVTPQHHVGRAVYDLRVYDLPVTETLWRLIDPEDLAVDVGANIGYMTGVMAFRCGSKGRVAAFEPQPNMYSKLRRNSKMWRELLHASIDTYQLALSDHHGEEFITLPDDSEKNSGLASLLPLCGGLAYSVPVERLDSLIDRDIGVMKIDVEGYESAVLTGATRLLKSMKIRDIVFEEHRAWPTPTITLLQSFGYSIFNLGVGLRGLMITTIREKPTNRHWEPRSCLATLNPLRALERLGRRGWQTLRNSSFKQTEVNTN